MSTMVHSTRNTIYAHATGRTKYGEERLRKMDVKPRVRQNSPGDVRGRSRARERNNATRRPESEE